MSRHCCEMIVLQKLCPPSTSLQFSSNLRDADSICLVGWWMTLARICRYLRNLPKLESPSGCATKALAAMLLDISIKSKSFMERSSNRKRVKSYKGRCNSGWSNLLSIREVASADCHKVIQNTWLSGLDQKYSCWIPHAGLPGQTYGTSVQVAWTS